MKKLLIGLVAIIGVLLVGVLVAAAVLPGEYEVSRNSVIPVGPEYVQPLLADVSTWENWTAWTKERDPECKWTYEGTPGAVGHTMEWDGPKLNKGKVVITKVEPRLVEYDLWFRDFDQSAGGHGVFELDARGDGTTLVTWTDSGPLDYPIGRLMGPMVDKMLGADFEKGLAGLSKAASAAGRATASESADDADHVEDLAHRGGDETK